MGSADTAITFLYFLTDKGRYNALDYFRMEIIEEIRFFFFSVENPVRNQSLPAEMVRKLKNKVRGLRRKKIKIYGTAFTEKFKALFMLRRFQRRI